MKFKNQEITVSGSKFHLTILIIGNKKYYEQVDTKLKENHLVSREVETKLLPLFTEATLISKMQIIGKDFEEEKNIYKDIDGIETPATRGQIFDGYR